MFEKIKQIRLYSFAMYLFYSSVVLLFFMSLLKYQGKFYIYIMFSIISNALLYFGFRKKALYFDLYIAVFCWLGFWLKLTVKLAFVDGNFHEPVGNFSGSGEAFDHALIVTSCGLLAIILASYVRESFLFNYPYGGGDFTQHGLLIFYRSHRLLVLISLIILILAVSLSNIYLGIYQRGMVSRTILPLGLNGVYKWLLLFGLASITAIIMRLEVELKNKASVFIAFLCVLEGFLSNISLLSRGMILNTGALIYGYFRSMRYKSIKTSSYYKVILLLAFSALFGCSVILANYVRNSIMFSSTKYNTSAAKKPIESTEQSIAFSNNISTGLINNASSVKKPIESTEQTKTITVKNNNSSDLIGRFNYFKSSFRLAGLDTLPLFLDRWVGIESVMAVTSYSRLGWALWQEGWREKLDRDSLSFYDKTFIASPYTTMDTSINYFISLPGILAFCYYPGSLWFLFISMFLISFIGSMIEILIFKFGGQNLILCSLLSQAVAYRFSSFGYVPSQSYLYFGAILASLFLIYGVDFFCKTIIKNRSL